MPELAGIWDFSLRFGFRVWGFLEQVSTVVLVLSEHSCWALAESFTARRWYRGLSLVACNPAAAVAYDELYA